MVKSPSFFFINKNKQTKHENYKRNFTLHLAAATKFIRINNDAFYVATRNKRKL